MPLPTVGQLAWGPELNADILSDETLLATLNTSIVNHEDNIPADPHQDRAYTDTRLLPITTGINEPNGYVVLNAQGKLPLGLVPVGAGLTNWIDAIPNYSVPTNGTGDASQGLNAALYQTSLNGGGIVYVGSGTFALANTLIIYPNTWLLCSSGAVFTRINLTSPPFAMIANYNSGVTPQNGNIRVTGGTWDIATLPGHSGCMFSFANATFILVEDMSVVGYPDGSSHIGALYGCNDVTIENLQITAGTPINSGRGNQHYPCFRVEECNSVNLPNCPNSVLNNQECSDINIVNCSLNGALLTDSQGGYSAWTSFCGTKGTMLSVSIHVNISITGGCFGSGFAIAAVEVINWSNVVCTGNNFNFPPAPYVCTWNGIAAQISTFNFDACSPRSYPPAGPVCSTASCSSTTTETIVAQFTIPGNDWIPGTTCYRHRHSGTLTVTVTDTITIKIRVGPNGNLTDTITDTITVHVVAGTNVPYCIHHRGFDTCSDGHWNPCGIDFISSCCSTTGNNPTPSQCQTACGTSRYLPTQGIPQYITHSVQWGTASNTCHALSGCHERANL